MCRLDGGNIIFMNGPMANGDMEYDSDSDTDSGKHQSLTVGGPF